MRLQGLEWILSCQQFEVKVWMQQGSVLSYFLLADVVDVVTEFARGCAKYITAC